MKILRFDRYISDPLPPRIEIPGGGIALDMIPDSAINRNRHPVFLPDFAREGWTVCILPAIQISRLGKFIAPRFASRYIGGITLCALLRPQTPRDGQDNQAGGMTATPSSVEQAGGMTATPPSVEQAGGMAAASSSVEQAGGMTTASPSGTPLLFDCALTTGEIFPYDNSAELAITVEYAPLNASAAAPECHTLALPASDLFAEELIARASIFTTLKSGDLIIPGSFGLTLPTTLNRSISANVNGAPILSTRIK